MVLESAGVARVGESTLFSRLRPDPMTCCRHQRRKHRAILADGFRLCRVIVDGQPCFCRKLAY